MTPADLKGKAGRRVLVEGVLDGQLSNGDFAVTFRRGEYEDFSRTPKAPVHCSAIREILPEPIKAGDRVKWHDGFEYTVNAIVGGRAWIVAATGGLDDVANLSDLTLIEPAPAADPDGWIEWNGGENPVPGKMAEVRLRNGDFSQRRADDFLWSQDAILRPGDIIAYRVIGDAQ